MVKGRARESRLGRAAGAAVRAVAAFPFSCAIVVLLGALLGAVHAWLVAWAEGEPAFRLDAEALEVDEVRSWGAPRAIGEEIRGWLEPSLESSLFSPGAVARVRARAEAFPWVESVASVRAGYPNRVRVVVELREPAAYVLGPGRGAFLVDRSGVRLPDRHFPFAENPLGLPAIEGAVSTRPPEGRAFEAPGVREGAALATRLRRLDPPIRTLRVAVVDVRKVPVTGEISLSTREGCRILWGRAAPAAPRPRGAPLAPALLRIPEERKIETLRYVESLHPGFRGVEMVNVGVEQPTFRLHGEASARVPPAPRPR